MDDGRADVAVQLDGRDVRQRASDAAVSGPTHGMRVHRHFYSTPSAICWYRLGLPSLPHLRAVRVESECAAARPTRRTVVRAGAASPFGVGTSIRTA